MDPISMHLTRRPAAGRAEAVAARLKRACVATALLGLGLSAGGVSTAEWTFEPRTEVGAAWTDNVSLAPSGAEDSDWISELKPGFSLGVAGPRAQAEFDYDLQALWFNDNSDLDDVYHQARGTGKFELVPRSLFLDAFTRYDQQNVDISRRVDYGNLSRTDNRTDAFVFGASPYHVGRWGTWGESLVRYSYRGVRYMNTDEGVNFRLQDSDTQSVSAALGSPSEQSGFSWRASGSTSTTDFDLAPEFKYDRVALDLGMPVGLRTRATATIGQESDVAADTTAGGLESDFWYLGFEWSPSELQSLAVRGGERYFGTAWDVNWRRRGSRGELNVEYTEEPTTSSGVLGDENVFQPGLTPGGLPSLDTRVFLRKRFSAGASYEFVRSTLNARAYSERRIFEDTQGGDQDSYGVTVAYDWEMAIRTKLGTTLNWERRDFNDGRSDDLGALSAHITRELTRKLSAIVRASHYFRSSDAAANEYDVNQVSLHLLAQF